MKKPFLYLKFLRKILEVSAYKNFGVGFQMPYKYIFLVTNKCNSRCKTCKIWKFYQDNPKLMKNELTFEEYEKIFENIKKEVVWLNFSGGEPFLREDLVELIRLAREKFKNLFLFTIPTNGLNPALTERKVEEMLEILDKVGFMVTVSIDALGELNDFIRGKKGTYEKSFKTYKVLKSLEKESENFRVRIQATLSRYNLDKINELSEKIRENIYFTFSQEASYFNNLDSKICLKNEEGEKVRNNLRYIENSYKIKNFEDFLYKIYLKLAQEYYKNPDKMLLPCYATYATATIDCYGNILPCSYFNSNVENLRDKKYNVEKIFRGEKMKEARNKIKSRKCPKCWTNCDGLPTLIQNLPQGFIKSIKSFLRDENQILK